MVNPLWARVDAAVALLAVRSILIVRGGSPFTTLGWFLAFWYGVSRRSASLTVARCG